jgi:hypothetical protein
MPEESPDWRSALANSPPGAIPDATIAELIDLDLRITTLPDGDAKNTLIRWLELIACRQVDSVGSTAETLPEPMFVANVGSTVSASRPWWIPRPWWMRLAHFFRPKNNELNPITALQDHVTEVEFYYRNFRGAVSTVWLIGVTLWITVAYFLYIYSSLHRIQQSPLILPIPQMPEFMSNYLNRCALILHKPPFITYESWEFIFLIFLAGIGGSAIAGLWRIYAQQFDYERAISQVYHPASEHHSWETRVLHFFELMIPAIPRAIVRPPLGGLFAWAITLILLSGLLLAPLVDPFVDDTGQVEKNLKAYMFFLAVGVVGGFSEELALNLLGRAAGAFDARGDS